MIYNINMKKLLLLLFAIFIFIGCDEYVGYDSAVYITEEENSFQVDIIKWYGTNPSGFVSFQKAYSWYTYKVNKKLEYNREYQLTNNGIYSFFTIDKYGQSEWITNTNMFFSKLKLDINKDEGEQYLFIYIYNTVQDKEDIFASGNLIKEKPTGYLWYDTLMENITKQGTNKILKEFKKTFNNN